MPHATTNYTDLTEVHIIKSSDNSSIEGVLYTRDPSRCPTLRRQLRADIKTQIGDFQDTLYDKIEKALKSHDSSLDATRRREPFNLFTETAKEAFQHINNQPCIVITNLPSDCLSRLYTDGSVNDQGLETLPITVSGHEDGMDTFRWTIGRLKAV